MAGLHHLGKELYQNAHLTEKWISPMSDLPVCPTDDDLDPGDMPDFSNVLNNSTTNITQPQLRRDPRVIRQQYLTQLGINLSSTTLERSIGGTGVKKKRHMEGIKVKLKGSVKADGGFSSSILQAISNWYTGSESSQSEEESTGMSSDMEIMEDNSFTKSIAKRKVGFHEEAEVFLIPLHNEYTARQRKGMWHSREEFMTMVERNLDAMYEEMEREYEDQLQRQSSSLEEGDPDLSSSLISFKNIPILESQEVTKAKLIRSPHEIRSKYLLQLGIDR